ncbi:MAG TPA: thioredoxin domain-containing protein [Anaerolineaceae bacterium]|nr:thioredoxin domain-containing protein [Anaerolineaceae bacterium]
MQPDPIPEIESAEEVNEAAVQPAGPQEESRRSPRPIRRYPNTASIGPVNLYALLLPLVFLAGLGAGYLVWGQASHRASSPGSAQATEASAAIPAGQKPVRYEVPDGNDPSIGPKDAPITIIEFSDYECPYCQKWHAEVFQKLLAAYPNQIRFVYRDFPLAGTHSNATAAAEAADCAGEQNRYFPFSEKLFSRRAGLSPAAYAQYAAELGLDQARFNDCVSTRKYKDEVQADYDYAANLGIRSTPTFFVNGLAVVGAQSFEFFKSVIDQELAGKIP